MKNIYLIFALCWLLSCEKKWENPPAAISPTTAQTTTIKTLKSLHTVYGAYDAVPQNTVISGVVIANDKSGNLYKTIVIQDSTGALNVLLDAPALYTSFPIGRKIIIQCGGLYLSDNFRLIELGVKSNSSNGSTTLEGVPSPLIDQYIQGGSLNNPYIVYSATIAQFSTNMHNLWVGNLIELSDVEFITKDLDKTFADTSYYKNSGSLTIKECSGNTTTLRTSGYAYFSGQKPPNQNGKIIALYNLYNTSKQLLLRDTSDIRFNLSRCNVFEEDFENTAGSGNLLLQNWGNTAEFGDVFYKSGLFSNNKYATISGFNAGGNPSKIIAWLVTPSITLEKMEQAFLKFQTIDGYNNGAVLSILISTNCKDVEQPSTANWTLLADSKNDPSLFAGITSNAYATNWKKALINISNYVGKKINIAFKYEGANPANGIQKTTTWEVDNIVVSKYAD